MRIAKPLARLIEAFQRLPGIGPKSAQRLTYYLLHVPQTELDEFAEALTRLKKDTVFCDICKNVSESNPCPICEESKRDKTQIMVVEQPLDILAFEKTGKYNGVYHVLHGAINPLENIGPDEIYIEDLIKRVEEQESGRVEVKEIIIATNPTMEGEATALYITKKLRPKDDQPLAGKNEKTSSKGRPAFGWEKLKITRLGMGVPTGADLEYADETTLREAIEGRREI